MWQQTFEKQNEVLQASTTRERELDQANVVLEAEVARLETSLEVTQGLIEHMNKVRGAVICL